jgi:type IV pilus assembly protein PilF
MNAGACSLKLGDARRAEAYFIRALAAEPGLLAAHASLARIVFDAGYYERARKHLLPVIASGLATADDFLLAIKAERKLGDRTAEQSLAMQWQRRLPDSPQWRAYQHGTTDER